MTFSKKDLQKIYDAMTFDNPDGGVWKQGWEVSGRSFVACFGGKRGKG